MQVSDFEMIGRFLLAAFLGSTIGFERERVLWAAGLRTHMLVAVGACLIMVVSAFGFSDVLGTPNVNLDPSRMAAQVVSGIGFLGAGAILMRGEVIRGLTTAASIWTVAGIGLAVGGGLYLAATAATIIILVILAGLRPLEEWYRQKSQTVRMQIHAKHGAFTIQAMHEALGYRSDAVREFVVYQTDQTDTDEITVSIERISHDEATHIADHLRKMPVVKGVALV